jgi:hypothetical protein
MASVKATYISAFKSRGKYAHSRALREDLSLETEEKYGGRLRRGRARRVHAGFRYRKGQQAISEKWWMGIRAVQLRGRI